MADITVYSNDQEPELIVKAGDVYQCPFCWKQGDYHVLVPHLQFHKGSIVKYKGFTIYKCSRGCIRSPHFHCCFCKKEIVRRDDFLRHLDRCPVGRPSASPPVAGPTASAPESPVDDPTTPPHSPVAGPFKHSRLKKTRCCFCNLRLYKKNLKLHIKRRHSSTIVDLSQQNCLPAVCADAKNGFFAVAKITVCCTGNHSRSGCLKLSYVG